MIHVQKSGALKLINDSFNSPNCANEFSRGFMHIHKWVHMHWYLGNNYFGGIIAQFFKSFSGSC